MRDSRAAALLFSVSLAAALGLIPVSGRCGTTVYHFTDDDGVTHFTNLPSDPRYRPMPSTDPPPPPRRLGNPKSRPYEAVIARTAEKYDLDPNLLRAVIKCESDFNHLAVSRSGAQGLMQLMPETARLVDVGDPFDARENLEGGARYLKYLLDSFGDVNLALAAYNAGEGTVRRHGGVPPFKETRNYVKAVLSHYERYRSLGIGADTITSADIRSFVNSEGVQLFTNQPWKYRKAADWRQVEAQ